MSREPKVAVTLRVGDTIFRAAQADAVRRGCSLEQWAEEVFEIFSREGFRASRPDREPATDPA